MLQLALTLFIRTATATTWYVDDDNGADFIKIQDALNEASNGNKNLAISKSITLQGELKMDIHKIQNAIKKDNVNITLHADEELANDNISDEEHGKVIEDYPEDKPFPSCLICGKDMQGRYIHSVWAYSEEHEIAVVVTAYVPDPDLWINYSKRR
ncbi:MAG: DUF4258 domain-containing protein [Methanosarcinales archaeon]